MKRIVLYLLFISLLISSCTNKSNDEISFAVIGDVHYRAPDFEATRYYIPLIKEVLDSPNVDPEFIIQSGDFFHSGRGADVDAESSFAFQHFAENLNRPFLITKGNHDQRDHFAKEAFPLHSGFLNKEISASYFSFIKADCLFIILDSTEEDLAVQVAWLEDELKAASSNSLIKHIFVVGHYPLWIVSRAGFTRPDYALPVAKLLAKYNIDAYFCGHTHNKTVTVRLVDGQPITQIMDAAIVEPGRMFDLAPYLHNVKSEPENTLLPGKLPLEESHQVFIPESELLYYRGYQEGSSTSFNVVSVKEEAVQVDWYVLNEGLVHSYMWEEPGKIIDLKAIPERKRERESITDTKQIDQAWLYSAFWVEGDSVKTPFLINGIQAGELTLNKKVMGSSPFWNKIEVEINKTVFDSLETDNEIIIQNSGKENFSLAHLFLLVKLKNGKFIRSNISPKVLTSFSEISGESYYSSTAEKFFPPAELIQSVNSGMPLKINLRLDEVLSN